MSPTLNILVVSDDASLRACLARLVRRRGHTALMVSSVEAAEENLRNASLQLVVSDWEMRDSAASELLSFIRQQRLHVSTLVVTGATLAGVRQKCELLGATVVTAKPWDNAALSGLIEELATSRAKELACG